MRFDQTEKKGEKAEVVDVSGRASKTSSQANRFQQIQPPEPEPDILSLS